jgi:hypothetical protein
LSFCDNRPLATKRRRFDGEESQKQRGSERSIDQQAFQDKPPWTRLDNDLRRLIVNLILREQIGNEQRRQVGKLLERSLDDWKRERTLAATDQRPIAL